MAPVLSKPIPIIILSTLLVLRSRLFTLPKDILTRTTKKGPLTAEELSTALQQLYTLSDDDHKTKLVLVPFRGRMVQHPIELVSQEKLRSDASHFPLQNAAFRKQLVAILRRVVFPTWKSKEAGIVFAHSMFLVLRTILSLMVAKLDGRIVRDLVSANGKGFLRGLVLWFLLAIPSAITNSMIRTLQTTLSISLRTRLTRYIHDLYLSPSPSLRYYRNNIQGIDQYITADVEAWCESVAGLYGNLLKPSLDLFFFTSQLSSSLGFRGTTLLFFNYWVTVRILRAVSPGFGRLAAVEARLEGEYRAGMGRVGKESEEVAFYDGGSRERDILTRAYLRLMKHVNSIYKIRIAYEWTEDFVIKYLWSAAGYGLIAVPLLFTRTKRAVGVQASSEQSLLDNLESGVGMGADGEKIDAVAGRTETYISNRRLLLSLADAGGRLMYAYKDILELAGLTNRLYIILSGLHSLNIDSATASSQVLPITDEKDGHKYELSHVDIRIPFDTSDASIPTEDDAADEDDSLSTSSSAAAGKSTVLVKDLTLTIEKADHLLITGSNGVGKTAIARVLAGLWDGYPSSSTSSPSSPYRIIRPKSFYVVPQRAYMVTGSLLDQVIYPHSYPDFLAKHKGDLERGMEELTQILTVVNLGYLPEREGGWDVRKEWRDVFSGGEKQRMGMARVFYHMPEFAILDECTSAVSSDIEGRIYEHAKSIGITLITISLRPSLSKYHNKLLTLTGDGSGSWTLSQTGTEEERMGIDREIQALEEKLRGVKDWEKRVKELEGLLSVQEI